MSTAQLLDWDSEILGIKVARIIPFFLTEGLLSELLHQLKQQNIQLVYWFIPAENKLAYQAALQCKGLLVDEKITYCKTLNAADLPSNKESIEVYPKQPANQELKDLAEEIGKLSRFGQDPNLSKNQVRYLYDEWINNACLRKVAKTVLITRDLTAHAISGFVTIDEKNNRGDLSLLSVSPQYQRQGIGKKLVQAAEAWCIQSDYSVSQVVTQKHNTKACRLYESSGYHIEKTEYVFHFWL